MKCPLCGKADVKDLKRHLDVSHPALMENPQIARMVKAATPENLSAFLAEHAEEIKKAEAEITGGPPEQKPEPAETEAQPSQEPPPSGQQTVSLSDDDLKKLAGMMAAIADQRIEARIQQAQQGQPAEEAAPEGQGGGNNLETILAVAKLFNKGSGGLDLNGLTQALNMAQGISMVVMKPFMDGQAQARAEMNDTIRLISGIKKLSPDERSIITGDGEGDA